MYIQYSNNSDTHARVLHLWCYSFLYSYYCICQTGLLGLKDLGIEVDLYIASEIDPDAIKVR